jgi:hypothetical protein
MSFSRLAATALGSAALTAAALTAVLGQESGIKVYGEQRGCALCDYDADGRVDVVMTQNGNATKLYHNAKARPGLRIRLRGNGDNPMGIGAKLRLIAGEKKGPVREIHAGNGYWSQDSAVAVMNISEAATQVRDCRRTPDSAIAIARAAFRCRRPAHAARPAIARRPATLREGSGRPPAAAPSRNAAAARTIGGGALGRGMARSGGGTRELYPTP